MLKIILLVLAAAIVVFLAFVAIQPADFKVARSATIAAPAPVVFEKVKALLLESDQSLAVIADATGFSDQSHMSKIFKRFTGTTPRLFRRTRRSHYSALR